MVDAKNWGWEMVTVSSPTWTLISFTVHHLVQVSLAILSAMKRSGIGARSVSKTGSVTTWIGTPSPI